MPFSTEINIHTLPALLVGGFLMLLGVSMSLRQWWSHRDLQQRVKVNETSYAHWERQIQLRLAMSGLFFLVGLLISIGNQIDNLFQQTPNSYFAFSSMFLGGLLILVVAIVALGLIDLVSTLAHKHRTSGELRSERQKIEDDLRRYREQRKSQPQNGSPTA